jgi:hypothetical protein
MKFSALLLALCAVVAHARPPAGELPSQEARNKAADDARYARAYAHCTSNPFVVNYCMAITLLEPAFCKKSEVTSKQECEQDIARTRSKMPK